MSSGPRHLGEGQKLFSVKLKHAKGERTTEPWEVQRGVRWLAIIILGKLLVFLGMAECTAHEKCPRACGHWVSEEATIPRDNCLLSCNTQVTHLGSFALFIHPDVPSYLDKEAMASCVQSVASSFQ